MNDFMDPFNLGKFGEKEAARFLKKNKCKILERNFRAGKEEIDIIARWDKIIIFVEVKTRSSSTFAQPWESVGYRKRQNIKFAARVYMKQCALQGFEFRFDVISVTVNDGLKAEIEWMQDAF